MTKKTSVLRRAAAAAAAVLAAMTLVPAAQAAAAPARGTVVSATPVQHLSGPQVRDVLHEQGVDTGRVRSGVDAYRLRYRTVDVTGAPTTASGLVVLPRDGRHRLRTVSFTHGTMAGADEAPSVDDGGRSTEGMLFASAGYAAVAPDYLGLGVGPGLHPYLDTASETTASVDMLRAATRFAGGLGRRLDPRVLVTGFSQGGAAATALGRALQRGADPRLRPAAVAPVSGVYDLGGVELPAGLHGHLDGSGAAFNFGYLVTAWQRIYGAFEGPTFRAPYDRTVAPLYDGRHDDGAIFAVLPDSPQQLFTPATLAALQHPTGRLAAALRRNDATCRGWLPGTPVHLFAAHTDEQVAFDNSRSCQHDLAGSLVPAPLTDLGTLKHLDSGRVGAQRVLAWFSTVAPPQHGG